MELRHLRYFVAVAGPETTDTDFTWAEFLRRNNDELVAGWGNLVNRSISMAAKNFGEIPAAGDLTEADQALLATARGAFATVGDLISRHRLKAAIGEAMRVVSDANKYLSDQAPWKIKDDPARLGTILNVALQVVSDCNVLLTPFLVLLGASIGVLTTAGQAGIANPGPHGFSEILYAYSSAANNNGSAFAGLTVSTPFYNITTGIAMWFGRFGSIIPVLAIAGALAAKKRIATTAGSLPTHGPLFVVLLLGTVVLVGALTYVPAFALGPVVEHLMMLSGK